MARHELDERERQLWAATFGAFFVANVGTDPEATAAEAAAMATIAVDNVRLLSGRAGLVAIQQASSDNLSRHATAIRRRNQGGNDG